MAPLNCKNKVVKRSLTMYHFSVMSYKQAQWSSHFTPMSLTLSSIWRNWGQQIRVFQDPVLERTPFIYIPLQSVLFKTCFTCSFIKNPRRKVCKLCLIQHKHWVCIKYAWEKYKNKGELDQQLARDYPEQQKTWSIKNHPSYLQGQLLSTKNTKAQDTWIVLLKYDRRSFDTSLIAR